MMKFASRAAILWVAGSLSGIADTAAGGLFTGKLAEGSDFDRLWSVPLLFQSPANPVLQELALQGQLQTQYAYGSDDCGNYGSGDMADELNWGDIEVRRFRLGMRAQLFHRIKLHSLLDLNADLSPRIYKRTAEAYITYSPSEAFNLSAGKTELKFTREQEISSREILAFERSQLANMMYAGELTAAWIAGKGIAGGWLYHAGVYANDRRDEWSTFDGGMMILAKTGYDYSKHTSFDHALAEFHYLHNTEPGYASPGDPASPSYSHSIAVSNELTEGPFGLTTEFFWGHGANGLPDIYGLTVMPSYYLTEKLQLVTTFQFAGSHEDNGISLPLRYEGQIDDAGDKLGDVYFAGYAGLDYYIYGHKLKLMSGVKYTDLSGGPGGGDFTGWTWLAGLRIAF